MCDIFYIGECSVVSKNEFPKIINPMNKFYGFTYICDCNDENMKKFLSHYKFIGSNLDLTKGYFAVTRVKDFITITTTTRSELFISNGDILMFINETKCLMDKFNSKKELDGNSIREIYYDTFYMIEELDSLFRHGF